MINFSDTQIEKILIGLVFNCPSSTRKIQTENKMTGKYHISYIPVSAMARTFKKRGINGSLLKTLMAVIRSRFNQNKAYACVNKDNLEKELKRIYSDKSHSDANFEFVVFPKRSEMPDVESFYYFLRNAFAHGDFKIVKDHGRNIYELQNYHNGVLKGKGRFKESTLLDFIKISEYNIDTIKQLQRKNKKLKK